MGRQTLRSHTANELRLTALNYNELPTPIRRGLSGQRGRYSERGVHKLRNAPSSIGHANSLRWRHAEGCMHTTQIIVRDVQRDCRNVIIKFL